MAKLTSVCEAWTCDICRRRVTMQVWTDDCSSHKTDYADRKAAIADGWRPYAVLRNYRTDRVEPPFIWRFLCPEHANTPNEELRAIIDQGPTPERWEIARYEIVEGPGGGTIAACSATAST